MSADTPAPRRKRRVRVIEVLDDEDIDEVLDAMDEEEAAEAGTATKAEPAAKAKAAEPEEEAAADEMEPDDPSEEAPEAQPKAKPKPRLKPPVSTVKAEPAPAGAGTASGVPVPTIVIAVLVVLVALLASLGTWQWRSASGLSADESDREAVAKVAAAYGDVALNYNASNYKAQMEKAQKLMGGDLLQSFKSNTLPNLGNTFKQSPNLVLTSKTDQVFVGSVEGRLATAVIMVDITVKTDEGSHDANATLLRLSIAEIDGEWKVTEMAASGDDGTNQGGALPQVPSSSTPPSSSPSPSPSETRGGN